MENTTLSTKLRIAAQLLVGRPKIVDNIWQNDTFIRYDLLL